MKKFIMVFGLALAVGLGVFSLTDSFAEFNFEARVIENMGCGCEEGGLECECRDEVSCGHADCGCAENAIGNAEISCGMNGLSCSGKENCANGSACSVGTGGCTAKKTQVEACGCDKSKN